MLHISFIGTIFWGDFDCYENTSKTGDLVRVKRRSAPASQTTNLKIIRRRGLVEKDSAQSLSFFDVLHNMKCMIYSGLKGAEDQPDSKIANHQEKTDGTRHCLVM